MGLRRGLFGHQLQRLFLWRLPIPPPPAPKVQQPRHANYDMNTIPASFRPGIYRGVRSMIADYCDVFVSIPSVRPSSRGRVVNNLTTTAHKTCLPRPRACSLLRACPRAAAWPSPPSWKPCGASRSRFQERSSERAAALACSWPLCRQYPRTPRQPQRRHNNTTIAPKHTPTTTTTHPSGLREKVG